MHGRGSLAELSGGLALWTWQAAQCKYRLILALVIVPVARHSEGGMTVKAC